MPVQHPPKKHFRHAIPAPVSLGFLLLFLVIVAMVRDRFFEAAFDKLLLGVGTTPLGFIVGTIVVFFINVMGAHSIREFWKWVMSLSELMRDLVIGLVLLVVLWVPLYAYFRFYVLPRDIYREADAAAVLLKPPTTQAATTPPFFAYEKSQKLSISFMAKSNFTFTPRVGDIYTDTYLADRQQYVLMITNDGSVRFTDVNLLMQLPYPIERIEVTGNEYSVAIPFAVRPIGLQMTFGISSGGSMQIGRTPLAPNWNLSIPSLEVNNAIYLLILLNSSRDPRGKVIPNAERQRYFVPDSGPERTYINGSFSYLSRANRNIKVDYYAPFILDDDKIVTLGQADIPPKQLMRVISFQ